MILCKIRLYNKQSADKTSLIDKDRKRELTLIMGKSSLSVGNADFHGALWAFPGYVHLNIAGESPIRLVLTYNEVYDDESRA